MDEPMPSTPASDTIQEEIDDSMESKPKDDSIVLTQPATDAPVTSLVLSAKPEIVKELAVGDKIDRNSPNPPAS